MKIFLSINLRDVISAGTKVELLSNGKVLDTKEISKPGLLEFSGIDAKKDGLTLRVPQEELSKEVPSVPEPPDDPMDIEDEVVIKQPSDDASLVYASFEDLFSEKGIELENTNEQFVCIVALSMGRGVRPTKVISDSRQTGSGPHVMFDSSEHVIIAQGLKIKDNRGINHSATTLKFHLANGLQLVYGDIIALAGDFYGLPTEPISDDPNPPDRFVRSFESLAKLPASYNEALNILTILIKEFNMVAQVEEAGLPPSAAYDKLGDYLSKLWNRATGGGSFVTDWYPLGRYLKLADTNWDHFGEHAIKCYTVGHNYAMSQAVAAKSSNKPWANLQHAYAINAFADHYLTDLFSGGHIRTPRKKIYEQGKPGTRYMASYLARFMHDEDCRNGLWVTNERNDVWIAYGDGRYRDIQNYANVAVVKDAVQASINDVYTAFTTGKVLAQPSSFTYIPKLSNVKSTKNWSPMFVYEAQSNQVDRRTNLNNLADYTWTNNWWVASTFAYLWKIYHGDVGPPLGPSGSTGSNAPTGIDWGATGLTGRPPFTGAPTGPDVPRFAPTGPLGPGAPTGP